MNKSVKTGISLAILAAALYALNSPLSKLLLDYMPSTLMAGFLYIGAGLGMGIIALIRKFTYFIALGFMVIGAWLCAKDEPILQKRKRKKMH